jgi:uncharacterized membrane protein YeaQ/YmgE (transglycosylase-associated protein family)
MKLWLAATKFALFLIQTDRRAGSATEDFSTWGTTYKVKWITLACALLIGIVAGAIAYRFILREEAMGLITCLILASAGSVVGTLIGGLIWRNYSRVFSLGGFLLSVVGAVVLLFLWRRVFTPR